MIVRTVGLGLFLAAAMTPAIAQNPPRPVAPAANAVQPCPPAGKVAVQDLHLETAAPATTAPTGKVNVQDLHRSGSGGGSGKASLQDIHRSTSASAVAPQNPTPCAVAKP